MYSSTSYGGHRDNSAGVVTRRPGEQPGFEPSNNAEIGSQDHPTSDPMGVAVLLSWAKRPEREANQRPPSDAKVKNTAHLITYFSPVYCYLSSCSSEHSPQTLFLNNVNANPSLREQTNFSQGNNLLQSNNRRTLTKDMVHFCPEAHSFSSPPSLCLFVHPLDSTSPRGNVTERQEKIHYRKIPSYCRQ